MARFEYTVQATSGMPAAATGSTPGGSGMTWPRGTATCSAYPPPVSNAHTGSPSRVPDTSRPRISLAPGGGG